MNNYNSNTKEELIKTGSAIKSETDWINFDLQKVEAQEWFESVLAFIQSANIDEDTKQRAIKDAIAASNYESERLFSTTIWNQVVYEMGENNIKVEEFKEKISKITEILSQLECPSFQYNNPTNMTEREIMISGGMYYPGDAELSSLRRNVRKWCETYNNTSVDDYQIRVDMLKECFGECGENVYIEPSFRCDYGCNIYVGDNFFANFDCVILDVSPVRFGKNCMLAPQVGIYTATHPLDPTERNSGREYSKPITIGDNCWIGGHATINPGVTLGNNVVVASGAVVTKSFGDNVVIGGNPAKVLKEIPISETPQDTLIW